MSVAAGARAQESNERSWLRGGKAEVAGFYGAATGDYGTGVGVRAGSWVGPLYLGGSMTWFSGERLAIEGGLHRSRGALLGGEVGLRLPVFPLVELRPYLFAGLQMLRRLDEAGQAETRTQFGLVPGTLLAVRIGPVLAGAEARVMLPPAPTAVGGFLVAGVSF